MPACRVTHPAGLPGHRKNCQLPVRDLQDPNFTKMSESSTLIQRARTERAATYVP
ncbi:hypothetical protein HETIRDRAFT_165917 [Heterobasidion irregulare TC 32-1]|uniref:Uncharacterized protein n=1 Tax=Heterobasidion irregulare (strain TC 32-1) TaxID=747525 RepID=W4KGI2_HETIT|nr:uncharacterized protein HETIRDRAFT_165917 [Heterobasidion irregulare TC 32-1]ETW84809.1 hypothetical protein HETIRDRAFT_165917 [Heterobasidion irregulare TC 32-1]